MNPVTRVLESAKRGDPKAAEELLPLVYDELRQLAAWQMAREPAGHTLQPTALVHEAWLRLGGNGDSQWDGRRHFFAAAAEAMRRILIERARRKQRLKRGGDAERVELEEIGIPAPMPDEELLALDEALDRLAQFEPRAAEVVKLCFFVGLTHEEAAQQLQVSLSTVERLWAFSRVWLFREIRQPGAGDQVDESKPPPPGR